MMAYVFCGQLALLQNEVEEAQQLLDLAGDQAVMGPMFFFDEPPVRARLLLTRGDKASVAQGQSILRHFLQQVEAVHNMRKTISVLGLQAWAYELQGRRPEATAVLEQALERARPNGFIHTFANVPGLAPVLEHVRKRRKATRVVDEQRDAYLQRILVAMISPPGNALTLEERMRHDGLEPLTERELQILHLLARDRTNKEIARELVVTPGTVKVHTNNLYRKLSVDHRRAAVTLAKALGLLVTDQSQ
jgi:LuxR family transcriptional regulator, maltose regulon positive regulatory protein